MAAKMIRTIEKIAQKLEFNRKYWNNLMLKVNAFTFQVSNFQFHSDIFRCMKKIS